MTGPKGARGAQGPPVSTARVIRHLGDKAPSARAQLDPTLGLCWGCGAGWACIGLPCMGRARRRGSRENHSSGSSCISVHGRAEGGTPAPRHREGFGKDPVNGCLICAGLAPRDAVQTPACQRALLIALGLGPHSPDPCQLTSQGILLHPMSSKAEPEPQLSHEYQRGLSTQSA